MLTLTACHELLPFRGEQREAGLHDAGLTELPPSTDPTPDPFSFAARSDQPRSTLVESEVQTIVGFDGTLSAAVTGEGSPQLRVGGGPWLAAATIQPGQSLQLRLRASPELSTARVAEVTVGTAKALWTVTTLAKPTPVRIFVTEGGYLGNLGGIGKAHALCQDEANSLGHTGLGHTGIFRALLSSTGILARDLLIIPSDAPVVRASDGTVVAGDLFAGSLQKPISTSSAKPVAWTGGLTPPLKQEDCCGDWRSAAASTHGRAGATTATNETWADYAIYPCNNASRLYCVEQAAPLGAVLTLSPRTAALPVPEATSKAASFTVENVGDTASGTLAIALDNKASFEVTSDDCTGKSLAPGETCKVSVQAKAAKPGAFTGTLEVTADNRPQASLKSAAGSLAFATTVSYAGSFGGLAKADAACVARAQAVGLGDKYKAVLSDDSTDAKSRFPAIRYPVITTTADVIASTDLWSQSPENGGARDELGAVVHTVWTGTLVGGGKAPQTCSSWTSTVGDGAVAALTCPSGSIFGCGSARLCNTSLPLLCLGE